MESESKLSHFGWLLTKGWIGRNGCQTDNQQRNQLFALHRDSPFTQYDIDPVGRLGVVHKQVTELAGPPFCERQGASRRYVPQKPAASALPLTCFRYFRSVHFR